MDPNAKLPPGELKLTLTFSPAESPEDRRVVYMASRTDLARVSASKVGSALQRIVYQMLEQVIDWT